MGEKKKQASAYREPLILIAFVILGAIIGMVMGEKASFLYPIGQIWLNLLFVLLVPLLFFSISSSIANISDTKSVGKLLGFTLVIFVVTAAIAGSFMFVVLGIFGVDTSVQLGAGDATAQAAASSIGDQIVNTFTVGDFPDVISRGHILALIVFTVIFSIAIIQTGEKSKPIVEAMDRLTAAIVNVINIVMKLAPLGLGCYFAILIGSNGSDVIGPLSKAIVMYLFVIVAYYVVSQTVFAYIGGGMEGVRIWWATCVPSTLTALGTCSSAASLQVNLQQAQKIGSPDEIADLVIPLGANLHKDGACVIQIIKVAFLCSVFHMEYATPRNILMSILVAVIASVVMGGIPAGGYVAEIFIISAFGFPTVAIPIMVLIGTITDAPATVVNVTGDTGLAMVITRFVEGKDWIHRKKLAQKAA